MPKHMHERKHHQVGDVSQGGFISNNFRKTMNKNEKIIMGVLVGGIVTFLILSIIVLFGKGKQSMIDNNPASNIPPSKMPASPYPTVPLVENFSVIVNSRRFNPESTSIPHGGYISFLNLDNSSMKIEGDDPAGNGKKTITVEPTDTVEVTFPNAGTYVYRSVENQNLKVVIVVK